MVSLYELSKAYVDIQSQDLTEEEMIAALNAVNELFEQKADNIAKLIRSMNTESEVIKSEEQRLAERRKSLENKTENLKKYLQDNMQQLGKEKIKTPLFSFNIQNNPPSVNILDDAVIPDEYLIPQEPKVDKKKILEHLKNGVVLTGIELKQNQSLRIK